MLALNLQASMSCENDKLFKLFGRRVLLQSDLKVRDVSRSPLS